MKVDLCRSEVNNTLAEDSLSRLFRQTTSRLQLELVAF